MKLTPQQVKDLGYVEINGEWVKAGSASHHAQPQPPVLNGTLAEAKGKAIYSGRVCVSVKSHRTRLCDPDNLCPKYFIDCLRYAGIIENDTPELVTLQVSQEKCKRKEARTVITITKE